MTSSLTKYVDYCPFFSLTFGDIPDLQEDVAVILISLPVKVYAYIHIYIYTYIHIYCTYAHMY